MKQDKNIPQGYKDSPLGIIPQEWRVERFEDFAPLQRGFDLPIDKIINGSFPVIFSNGHLKYHNEYKAKAPGVVTGRSGTIGKVTYIEKDYWPHNTALWVTDFKSNLPKYVYYFIDYIDLVRFSSGSGVPTLNRNDVHKYKIIVPPLPEQQKIAEILTCWDTAIEKQTQLIEKLETRKRGLMQQLLTGKKRLKGFEGEVLFKQLKPFIKELSVRNNKSINTVLSVTNLKGFIEQREQFDRVVASEDLSNYKIVQRGQFAYNPSRVNVGSLDLLRTFDIGILSPMYIVFETDETKLLSNFLYYQLKTFWFTGHIPMFVQGSVRDSLSFDGLCAMKFFVPSIPEQTAIANILSATDEEIRKEKEKLTALRSQKKGLMQVLLTGKKRVKI